MSITTIFIITLAALVALGFVFFKYFHRSTNRSRNIYFLAFFRFVSIFTLLLLLINPTITQREFEVEKAMLLLAVDNSTSIDYLEGGDSVVNFANSLRNNRELQERFDVIEYGFGGALKQLRVDSLSFAAGQTNISRALNELSRLSSRRRSALVLMTDGNQTVGESYQYFSSGENQKLFPVVVGDTTTRVDLSIQTLNANRYAFLNNQFPVEVFLSYNGSEPVESRFEIRTGTNVLFSQVVNFTGVDNVQIISATLPATTLGAAVYEAEIFPLQDENNIVNNIKRFGVEVVDERTSVLILSAITHPDLGMFKKAIESNEQRQAEIVMLDDFNKYNINDYQLIVIYQPNQRFKDMVTQIMDNNINFLLVTGSKTNWVYVNSIMPFSRDFTMSTQDYIPLYNPNYFLFQFEDLEFESFPPVEDLFGALEFENNNYSPLLLQQVEGIRTGTPLLATYDGGTTKHAVLFGENSWKWRVQSYVNTGSFEQFDSFFGKLVQYLASQQVRERLTLNYRTFYNENEELVISAQYFDRNYQFDPGGNLVVRLESDVLNEQIEASFLPGNNRYVFTAEDLLPGEYNFTVRELNSGLSKEGSFTILEYNVEQQFSSANLSGMETLASNTGSTLYFLNNQEKMMDDLLSDNRFLPVQKSREKALPLINWRFLLGLLIVSLAIEWFTRKYFGLI